MVLGFAISGPESKSKQAADKTASRDLIFPDIRTKGDRSADKKVIVLDDPSKLKTVEKLPPTYAPEFRSFPAPREIERIPMPDPGFGVPAGDPIPGSSSYPPYQNQQQASKEVKRVPIAPVIPNRSRPLPPHEFEATPHPQFHCDCPILETLGQIAVAEVEQSCGLQIKFNQGSGIELKSGSQLGVDFDIKVPPCSPHAGHRRQKQSSPAVNITAGILEQIYIGLRR